MSTDPPLVVELFSQPGAGKSTLVRSVAATSELHGRASLGATWKQLPKLSKLGFLGRTIRDRACLVAAMEVVRDARLFRSDSLSRLARLMVKSHWLRSQTGRWLLEEGHLQDLWSILYSAGRREPDPRQFAPLIACLYRGLDVQIVYLDVDSNDAFDRIRARTHGKSRLDRLANAELRQQLTDNAQLPSRLVEAARLAGLKVETFDASLAIEKNAGRLGAMVQMLGKDGAG